MKAGEAILNHKHLLYTLPLVFAPYPNKHFKTYIILLYMVMNLLGARKD